MQWIRIILTKEQDKKFKDGFFKKLNSNYSPYFLKGTATFVLYENVGENEVTYLAKCDHAAMIYNFREQMPNYTLLYGEQSTNAFKIVFGGSNGESFI